MVHRTSLVGGAAALLGILIEGPTGAGEALPFTVTRDAGTWHFQPRTEQHVDVFLLKALLWWKVVPKLKHEQAVRDEWMKHVLDETSRRCPG